MAGHKIERAGEAVISSPLRGEAGRGCLIMTDRLIGYAKELRTHSTPSPSSPPLKGGKIPTENTVEPNNLSARPFHSVAHFSSGVSERLCFPAGILLKAPLITRVPEGPKPAGFCLAGGKKYRNSLDQPRYLFFDINGLFCYFKMMTFNVISNKKLVTGVNFSLSALLLLTCIFLVRDFINLSIRGAAPENAHGFAPANPANPRPLLADYSAVAKDNIFGFPPMDVKPLTAAGGQAASSNVALIGTVSGAWNYAVVLRDSKQEVYQAGQMIPGFGYLKSIHKDYALVKAEAGGGDVKLPLKQIAQVEEANSSAAPAGQAYSPGPIIRSQGGDSYVLNKGAVADAIQNPTRILSDARMLPNIVNGKQQGFVIREVKPGGLFGALGLRNGDVLLKINNNEISGPDMALRAFTALKGLDRVDLDIIRGGQKLTLVYQIR